MVTIKDIQTLDMFMQVHNIPYVLTGTAALMVHGILPEGYAADDIDIIVLVNQDENSNRYFSVEKTLKQLELLSGEDKNNADYNSVITFRVNSVKVNAFMGGREIHKQEADNPNNYIGGFGEEGLYRTMTICANPIKVSCVNCILAAKFSLKRMKDYKFAKDLVSTILKIGF